MGPARPGLERIEAFFAGHAFDPHRHDTYALGVTLSGVQSFRYRGTHADSTRGMLMALHPDETHDGHAGAEGGFRYRMLYLSPRLVAAALGERAGALPFVRAAVSRDVRLARALHLALGDLRHGLEELEAESIVLTVADALLALDPSAARRASSALAPDAVERARELLEAGASRQVTAAELEAASGLDRYTLARQFRARLGTSPYRYLVMRRLDTARALLRAGRSLADAAYATGFSDQSHMTRQFKRAFGLPPGRWRAMQAEGTFGESGALA